uniref:E2F-associated phosphoprotein n=1 Tax=Parastrongyloides trichosuri TaxID=131310 RepID=A0A0N4ZIF1_PARTI
MTEDNPLINDIKLKAEGALEADADFYCALEDDLNQKWVDDKIRRQKGMTCEEDVDIKEEEIDLENSGKPYGNSDFKTDAVLSCPSCLTTVCYESQRHELYKNQYRAMFAESVTVDFDKKLYIPINFKGKIEETHNSVPENARNEDIFYPVNCVSCKHQIGVYDYDEVFHFYEVVTGYS